MQNSDSLGRLIARELRSGNRYHQCQGCGTDKKPSSRTPEGDFCEDCRGQASALGREGADV